MGVLLGNLVRATLVHGLSAFERVYPMPVRLGRPLPTRVSGRDPIILVPGFANSASPGWDEWRRSLIADGFDVWVIELPTRGLGDMQSSAAHVAASILEVRRRTGAGRVDVVGFSEGGLLARMAVAHHGLAGGVDRVITLASPNDGLSGNAIVDALSAIPLLGRLVPEAVGQMRKGSNLIETLRAADEQLRLYGPVRYASIHSRSNDGVVSAASTIVPGMLDIPVAADPGTPFRRLRRGPSHFGMFHLSNIAFEAARLLLLDAE